MEIDAGFITILEIRQRFLIEIVSVSEFEQGRNPGKQDHLKYVTLRQVVLSREVLLFERLMFWIGFLLLGLLV